MKTKNARRAVTFLAAMALWNRPLIADGKGGGKEGCVAIEVDPAFHGDIGKRKPVFKASKVLNVSFRALYSSSYTLGDQEVLRVRYVTPSALLYQEVDVPVVPIGSKGESKRGMPGYPFPVDVARAAAGEKGSLGLVVIPLPAFLVGGTAIQQSGLYGKWKVEAALDSGGGTCSTTFAIDP